MLVTDVESNVYLQQQNNHKQQEHLEGSSVCSKGEDAQLEEQHVRQVQWVPTVKYSTTRCSKQTICLKERHIGGRF